VSRGIPVTVICGHPLKFYNLNRPRSDTDPVCHRSPHEGNRHLSAAAIERGRQRKRERAHLAQSRGQVLAA